MNDNAQLAAGSCSILWRTDSMGFVMGQAGGAVAHAAVDGGFDGAASRRHETGHASGLAARASAGPAWPLLKQNRILDTMPVEVYEQLLPVLDCSHCGRARCCSKPGHDRGASTSMSAASSPSSCSRKLGCDGNCRRWGRGSCGPGHLHGRRHPINPDRGALGRLCLTARCTGTGTGTGDRPTICGFRCCGGRRFPSRK